MHHRSKTPFQEENSYYLGREHTEVLPPNGVGRLLPTPFPHDLCPLEISLPVVHRNFLDQATPPLLYVFISVEDFFIVVGILLTIF